MKLTTPTQQQQGQGEEKALVVVERRRGRRTAADLKTTKRRPGRVRRVRSRPETPLLRWKVNEHEVVDEEEEEGEEEVNSRVVNTLHHHDVNADVDVVGTRRRTRRRRRKPPGAACCVGPVSARKLAAGIWRLQAVHGGGGTQRREGLGFQAGAGHVGISVVPCHSGKGHGSESEDPLRSPSFVSGAKSRFMYKIESPFQFASSAMEGATKWDPVSFETPGEARQIYGHMKRIDQQVSAVSMVAALEAEVEQARSRIQELETERKTSKKKLELFLKKVSEERAAWRSREHEKIRAFIDDTKADLNRERKNRQRLEILNSKLVNELADAKLSAKRFKQEYEKERKARELIEEVCDELAKEIGEDKAEIEALRRDSVKVREEVDDERRMLQMAEVWREERVQMKLVDAKVALEQKYSLMNKLVSDLETFLRSKGATLDLKEMKEAESLMRAASSVDIQDVKEFTYEPPNPDDIFSVFEDVNYGGEANEREIGQCIAYSPASHASKVHTVSPEVIGTNKDLNHRHSDDEIEEDESVWETDSHMEDQGSCYSPEGSAPSVNKNPRDSNVSRSGTEWGNHGFDGTPTTEIGELCSVPTKQLKKGSSITRLWRSGTNGDGNYKIISVDGVNGRISNGRKSSVGVLSPDGRSDKGGLSPPELVAQWSSPESVNHAYIPWGKGCIEWPRAGSQKNSLKSKLMQARMESQKVQIRHVLKQKI